MILVTGATGILGRVIVLELIKKGFTVRASRREDSDLQDVLRSFEMYSEHGRKYFNEISWVNLDFDKQQSIYKALQNVTEVYHCAAKISFDHNDTEEVLQTGITATKNLLSACQSMGVEKFLYVSSSSTLNINKNIIETSINGNSLHNSIYSPYLISKYIGEKLVRDAQKDGLNTVIINPGMIVGIGNWKSGHSQLLNFLQNSKFTFTGGASCIDARDVAKIAIMLMNNNLFGERFCITSEFKLYRKISEQVRKEFGLSKPIVITKRLMNIFKPFKKILARIVPDAKLLTRYNIEFVSSRQHSSSKKLRKFLNISFTPIDETIKFYCISYKKYMTSQNRK